VGGEGLTMIRYKGRLVSFCSGVRRWRQ